VHWHYNDSWDDYVCCAFLSCCQDAATSFVCCSSSPQQGATPGRKLLASSGGGSSSAAGGHAHTATSQWAGYQIALASNANHAVDEAGAAPEIGRFVGASAGSNRVIGGLFLHTTRKTSTRAECAGGQTVQVRGPHTDLLLGSVLLQSTCVESLTVSQALDIVHSKDDTILNPMHALLHMQGQLSSPSLTLPASSLPSPWPATPHSSASTSPHSLQHSQTTSTHTESTLPSCAAALHCTGQSSRARRAGSTMCQMPCRCSQQQRYLTASTTSHSR
jgi:hypothetical protein